MSRADFEVIEKALQSTNDDPAIYIAELDGGIAGFIHLHSVVDYYRQRQHGHVADLVVDPAAEGQGVATRLLSEAELWARRQSFDCLSIAVFEENHVGVAPCRERVGSYV